MNVYSCAACGKMIPLDSEDHCPDHPDLPTVVVPIRQAIELRIKFRDACHRLVLSAQADVFAMLDQEEGNKPRR